ncbi:tetratricopeptide repeat protein [Effusibacillus dendaii]|uniref:HTH cro/C1-type domain-containing protein n=1 Tax=Effusibacillus dendaii TaxID=2743772 RepID=A0A7I8DAE5_9BACL|nr:tetratricopeptide repeat protein [Effusibacillus dendaii]BCJ86957.1 hypothetical protein skT53_19420 [Effusibacillus dendaii]
MTKTLGQKIRELRMQKGMTQGDLGGGRVTPSMISQIEADKANPSHRLLKWIADRLETPIEFFLTDMQLQSEKISSFRFAKALIEAGEPGQAVVLLEPLADGQSLPMYQQEIQQDLATCYRSTGQLDKAAKQLEEIFSGLLVKRDLQAMVQVLFEMGSIEKERNQLSVAVYHWNRANQLYEEMDSPDPFQWGKLLRELAELHTIMGDLESARAVYEQAMTVLSGTEDLRGIADMYLKLSRIYRDKGSYEEAARYAEHALSIHKGFNNLKTAVQIKEMCAMLKAEQGFPKEAVTILTECLSEYEKYGFADRLGSVHGSLSIIYLRMRQLDLAKSHCQTAIALANDDAERAALYRTWAETAKEEGNLQEAKDFAQKSVQFFNRVGMSRELMMSYSLLGNLCKASGDLSGALQAFEEMQGALQSNLKHRGIVL